VIGAIVAGAIVLDRDRLGRWFQPKLTIETYFNESVQGSTSARSSSTAVSRSRSDEDRLHV
jgi:hypothetical protein